MALTDQEELELLELEAEEARAKAAGKAPEKPGIIESAGRGAAQGASLGFIDEAAGAGNQVKAYLNRKMKERGLAGPAGMAVEAASAAIPGAIPVALADMIAEGGKSGSEYIKGRDAWREADRTASEENPVAYGAGNLAGSAATMLIPGANAVTAGKMAALGGIAGLGATEADLTKGEISDAAEDAGTSALLGYGIGKGARALAPLAEKASTGLKNAATGAARRAIGYSKRFITKQGKERADEVARIMLDEGAIPWSGSAEETLKRIQEVADKSGSELGRVREALDKMGIAGVPRRQALKALSEMLPTQKGGIYDDMTKHILKARETVAAHGKEIPFGEAEELKTLLWKAGGKNDDIQREAFHGASRAIRKAAESKLDESAKMLDYMNPNRTDNITTAGYLKNKKLYGAAADASDVALDKVNREAGNSFPSLRGTIAAGSRLGAGDIMGAAGALGVTETALRRGAGFSANAANKIADYVKKSPKVFGKFAAPLTNALARSPETFAVTHYLLGQQDPEYQGIADKIQKGEDFEE